MPVCVLSCYVSPRKLGRPSYALDGSQLSNLHGMELTNYNRTSSSLPHADACYLGGNKTEDKHGILASVNSELFIHS